MRASLIGLILFTITLLALTYGVKPLMQPHYKVVVYVVGEPPSTRAAVYTIIARHAMIGAILVKRYVEGVSTYIIPLDNMAAVPGGQGPLLLAGCISYEKISGNGTPQYCGTCGLAFPEQVKGYILSSMPTREELLQLLDGVVVPVEVEKAECYYPQENTTVTAAG